MKQLACQATDKNLFSHEKMSKNTSYDSYFR